MTRYLLMKIRKCFHALTISLLVLGSFIGLLGLLVKPAQAVQVGITVTGLNYDSDQEQYVIELAIAEPNSIGSLQITLSNAAGLQEDRVIATQLRPIHKVEISAASLVEGQEYLITITGFTPDGSQLASDRGDIILATYKFDHLSNPSASNIGNLLFEFDGVQQSLIITFDVENNQEFAAYRVVLKDKRTNVVVLEQRPEAAGVPPIILPFADQEEGQYSVLIQALDASGKALVTAEDEFSHIRPALAMGLPTFQFDDKKHLLLIDFPLESADDVDRFQLLLIDKGTNSEVFSQVTDPDEKPPVELPLEGVGAGNYIVQVNALSTDGQTLGSAQNETTYIPPKGPGILSRMVDGLMRNPAIPIAILLILLAIVGWLIFKSVWERGITGTPILENSGITLEKAKKLPLDKTDVYTLRDRKPVSTHTADGLPPRLALTIRACPDRSRVGEIVQVTSYPFSMGRGECTLVISGDTQISRRHAEIRYDKSGLQIVDLLSSNGTFVDDQRITAERPFPLNPKKSTQIALGKYTQLFLEPA